MEAGRKVDKVRRSAFEEVGARIKRNQGVTEFEIQQYILHAFERSGLETDHGPIVAVNATRPIRTMSRPRRSAIRFGRATWCR